MAAITQINLINAALVLVGDKTINSLTDANKRARLAKDLYDIALKDVYDLPYNWRFATTRATLSELADEPAFGYDYQYAIPEDSRRIISMVDEDDDSIEFEWRRELYRDTSNPPKEYDVILTNEDTVRVKYVSFRENPAQWPGWFVKLVYTRLAVLLSEPLKQSNRHREQLRSMYQFALDDAVSGNGSEDADVNIENRRTDKGSTEVVEAARQGFFGANRSAWGRRSVS